MLKGKIALVTGASRGIGRQIAISMAREGALVIVNYNGSKERAKETVNQIQENGGKAEAIGCNVADFNSCKEMLEDVISRYGRLDILVNNAGFGDFGEFTNTDLDKELNMMDVNIKAVHILTKLFLQDMVKRDKGYMVYIKSSEEISDFIKMLGAINALFYYEDIRIYRDHKNMVNRLNNCEQANVEKSLKTCNEQLSNIEYLKNNDLLTLLDEKTGIVIEYRLKYPETTMNELAEIISLETDYKITKSGINHHFRKIKDLVIKHQKTLGENA